jgi:DNA damage-inducible protein 1
MLYINVEVNGHKVKAFVDSGAQATISGFCISDTNSVANIEQSHLNVLRLAGELARSRKVVQLT